MTQQPPYAQPDLPPELVPPGEPSKWPLVIGIISIAWAVIKASCIGIGQLSQVIFRANPRMPHDFPAWLTAYSIGVSMVTLGIAAVLLVGGVLLLKRRPAARPLHIAFACMEIPLLCLGAVMSVVLMGQMNLPTGPGTEVAKAMMPVFVVCSIVIWIAYPVFLLIWFLRRKVRQEVASWRTGVQVV